MAPPLSRRQVVAASASGALLGSSWALAFQDVTSQEDAPLVTVARDESSLAMLIEYLHNRIAVLDAGDEESLRTLTEIVTGFMKQRIDLLVATTDTAALLPSAFMERWRIPEHYTLPDSAYGTNRSMSDRALAIGDLTITAARIPSGEWHTDAPPDRSPWYLATTFHSTQVILASTAALALNHPRMDPSIVTCFVSNDATSAVPDGSPYPHILVRPAEAGSQDSAGGMRQRRVPLYPEVPVSFRMGVDRIVFPRQL